MSTPELGLLVAAGVALLALIVAGFVGWLRRLTARNRARLEQVLSAEPAIRGPERATYRGSTGGYSKVSASGLIALTDRALVFRKSTGGCVDVPVAEITGVRLARQFSWARFGPLLLVVQAPMGELVYLVSNPSSWRDALEGVMQGG